MIQMFAINEEYQREDLLTFVGSKQNQSGIIWGKKESACVIVTSGGRHGKMVGYGDEANGDGSWTYVGQGSKGDQDPNSFANSLLASGERAILLFSTREPNANEVRKRGNYSKLYKFEGIFHTLSWDFYRPKSGKRARDKLIIFSLVPAEHVYNFNGKILTSGDKSSLAEPRIVSDLFKIRSKLARTSQSKELQSGGLSLIEYKKRSLAIKRYALLRANGKCENCTSNAPFFSLDGLPFLEVHHILSLPDDGPDSPENVAAHCPNCHREVHFGINRQEVNQKLLKIVSTKEQQIMNRVNRDS